MNLRAKLGLSALTLFCVLVLLALATRTPAGPGMLVPTANTTTARFAHTATLPLNGKVLSAGGMEQNGVWLESAELYDPAQGRYTAIGKMSTRRAGARTSRLPHAK